MASVAHYRVHYRLADYRQSLRLEKGKEMGKHTDSIECDCLTIAIKPTDGMMVDHCQYLHCLRVNEATGRFGGYLTRATDGTQMHPECWSAYDREWRTLHPETNQAIVDGMTEQAEKRAGA